MANSNINILDVEKVEKTISKLESLNESIDGYAKVLRSETNKMSNYWKDNKYKEIKEKFEDDARILNRESITVFFFILFLSITSFM